MLAGAFTALVTPFQNGQVDEDSLRRLIESQIEAGINGLVPCGSTGESATLSHEEHKRVIELTIDQVKGRVPVVAGAGSNNTAEAIELARHAKQAGADATLQIAPYYNKPTQEGLYQHFAAIAGEVALPMVVYNIQGRTAVNITPETLARLAKLPEVAAVKEASGSLPQMSEIYNLCGDRLTLLAGDDAITLPLLAIGGKGVISVITNLVPRDMLAILEAWNQGDTAGARDAADRLFPLCKAMFIETNPIPIKTAMAMLGQIASDELRLPLTPISPGAREQLQAALSAHGLM